MARLTNRHNPHVTIDARSFDKMVEDLMRFTGKSFEQIIKHEAARILEGSIKRTNPKLSDAKKSIKARYTYNDDARDDPKRVTYAVVEGKRRLVRKIHRKGFFVMRGRGKNRKKVWDPKARNPLWRPLQAELKRLREQKTKRVGQSKGTWVYIAKRAKIPGLKGVPKYVQSAPNLFTSNLKAKLNGSSANKGKHAFVVTMKNFGRVAMIRGGRRRGADGFAAFRQAFKGREGYFRDNLALGVFEKTSKIARKYKGLMVTPLQNKRGND